jgi:hypothetical protein
VAEVDGELRQTVLQPGRGAPGPYSWALWSRTVLVGGGGSLSALAQRGSGDDTAAADAAFGVFTLSLPIVGGLLPSRRPTKPVELGRRLSVPFPRRV